MTEFCLEKEGDRFPNRVEDFYLPQIKGEFGPDRNTKRNWLFILPIRSRFRSTILRTMVVEVSKNLGKFKVLRVDLMT